jgi:exonuclease SbcC
MAITPYYASLMDPEDKNCPVRKQAVPTSFELHRAEADLLDPLAEDEDSPTPGLTHRYPDRVLFLITDQCPVCGGIEHPRPAKIEEGTPSEKELKDLKVAFDEIDEKRKNLLTKLAELKTKEKSQISIVEGYRTDLKLIYEDLPELSKGFIGSYIIGKKDDINDEIKNLKEKTKELYELKESEENIKSSIIQAKEELEKEEKSFEKTKSECIELNAKIKNLAETIKGLADELPEGITTTEAMEKMIIDTEDKLSSMEKTRKAAEEALKTAETKLTEAVATQKEKIKAHNEAIEEYNKALLKLDEDIKKAGFIDRNDYKASRMDETKIEALEEEVKKYYGQLKSAQDRYDKALRAVSGLAFVDTEKIEKKIADRKIQKEEAEGQNKKVYARLKKNMDIQNNLSFVGNEIKEKETEYRKISYLAELAKGNNSEKLSFERYVLAAYFDDIIEAANIRLKRMTEGRFELTRIQEKQKGRAQQGLDLEVYDYYTGRPRHVKVISGGESFKASLSLALGLSDVVSSTSGGISIDTIFIDEGFGTLDPESLEKSILFKQFLTSWVTCRLNYQAGF